MDFMNKLSAFIKSYFFSKEDREEFEKIYPFKEHFEHTVFFETSQCYYAKGSYNLDDKKYDPKDEPIAEAVDVAFQLWRNERYSIRYNLQRINHEHKVLNREFEIGDPIYISNTLLPFYGKEKCYTVLEIHKFTLSIVEVNCPKVASFQINKHDASLYDFNTHLRKIQMQ